MEERISRLFTRNRTLRSQHPTNLEVTIVLYNVSSSEYPSLNDELQCLQHFQIVRIDDINEWVDRMTFDTSENTILLIIPREFIDIAQILREALPQIKRTYLLEDATTVSLHDDDGRYSFRNIRMPVSTLADDICNWRTSVTQKIVQERPSQSLSGEPATFIWYQFFFNLFDQLQLTGVARRELIDVIHSQFDKNDCDKRSVKEFKDSYSSEKAIYWYTRESFLYGMINKMLRSRDINAIFEYRAILIDIQRQLKNLHDAEINENCDVLTVYRGQQMTTHEIQYYKENLGDAIAINPFISTSADKQVAEVFADSTLCDEEHCAVITIIRIRSNVQRAIHASIDHVSAFPDEAERLLSWHSLFRVNDVEREETGRWNIQLTLIDEDDPQFRKQAKAWETSLGNRSFFDGRQAQLFMRDLNEASGPFLSFQILMDIVLRLKRTDYAKEEMVELCRKIYATNDAELTKIDKFERTYNSESAAQWYTKDSFLYRLMNETLRWEKIDLIFKLRLFIHDLHNQLDDLQVDYLRTIPVNTNLLTFYRGELMTMDELQEFYIGNLISVNSFLSTTTDRDTAHIFAGDVGGGVQDPNVSVIYEITVDLTVPHSIPFASIAHLSTKPDEKEVLFSMTAVFRINEIKKLKERVSNVKLSLINREDERWKALTAHLK